MHELVSTARRLTRRPAFLLAASSSLALAVALVVTQFSVLQGLLHPVLPFRDSSALRILNLGREHYPGENAERFLEFRGAHHVFSDVASLGTPTIGPSVVLDVSSDHIPIEVVGVTSAYFQILGVSPAYGRLTTSQSDMEREVVISYELWSKLPQKPQPFHPIPVRLAGQGYTIAGVLPPSGNLPTYAGVFVPIPDRLAGGQLLVRLAPGTTDQVADTELLKQLTHTAHPGDVAASGPCRCSVEPIVHVPASLMSVELALSLCAVVVLLLASANVANLQFARALTRQRELVIRRALGATSRVIVKHLASETVFVAGVGILGGLLLSWWFVALVRASRPSDVDWLAAVATGLDSRVLLFATFCSAAATLVTGIYPALLLARDETASVLGSRSAGLSRRGRFAFSGLVGVQIAGALALVTLAALLVQTAKRISTMDLGYNPEGVVAVIARVAASNDTSETRRGLLRTQRISEQLAASPAVSAFGSSFYATLDRGTMAVAQGRTGPLEFPMRGVSVRAVSSDYLRALRMGVVHGREFASATAGPQVIIDQGLAARLWPNRDPIGQLVKLGPTVSKRPWMQVVGVVRRPILLATECPTGDCAPPVVFAFDSHFADYAGPGYARSVEFAVRLRSTATPGVGLIQNLVSTIDPSLYYVAAPWTEAMGLESLQRGHRFLALLFSVFAALGMLLAVIGVLGVTFNGVAARMKEFGIRLALGATPASILRLVLRDCNRLALLGLAAGLIFTQWGVKLVEASLYDSGVSEPLIILSATILLWLATVLAALGPASRASRIPPQEVLRFE